MSAEQLQHVVDRTGWDAGPWDKEPDRLDWEHAGFACMALRNDMGSWCGYVGVPNTHPFYGVSDEFNGIDVHGSVTYASKCAGHICHVPKPGMPDDVWWIGFDCGHAFDLSPRMAAIEKKMNLPKLVDAELPREFRRTYKDEKYIRAETSRLADQLAAMNR